MAAPVCALLDGFHRIRPTGNRENNYRPARDMPSNAMGQPAPAASSVSAPPGDIVKGRGARLLPLVPADEVTEVTSPFLMARLPSGVRENGGIAGILGRNQSNRGNRVFDMPLALVSDVS